MLRKFMKVVLWSAAALVVAAAAVPLAIIAINAFDDELSAEARALSAPPQFAEAGQHNGYIEMLGLDAPAGEDQRPWGLRVLASLRAQDTGAAANARPKLLQAAPLVGGSAMRWCNPALQSCLAAVPQDAAALLRQHALALERYRAMRDKPEYAELYAPDRIESRYPSYAPFLTGQLLTLLDMAVAVHEGRIDAAFDQLEREVAFHRRMAAGSRTVIGKMVAANLLVRDTLFLSDLMRSRPAEFAPLLGRAEALLAALTPQERSLAAGYRSDSAALVRYMLTVDRDRIAADAGAGAWWMSLAAAGFRRNATANLVAQQLQQTISIDAAPMERYAEVLAADRRRAESEAKPGLTSLLVNPTGRLLVNVGTPVQGGYTGRMHDLQALLALVGLQRALPAAGAATPEAVSAALGDKAFAAYRNPYTGQPMRYDAQAGTLSFEPVSRATWVNDMRARWNGRVAVALR